MNYLFQNPRSSCVSVSCSLRLGGANNNSKQTHPLDLEGRVPFIVAVNLLDLRMLSRAQVSPQPSLEGEGLTGPTLG